MPRLEKKNKNTVMSSQAMAKLRARVTCPIRKQAIDYYTNLASSNPTTGV
jgi:hypothetical protein